MNIISVVLILVILLMGVLGFKKGLIKTSVQLVGMIAILIIAYTLKDIVADFLMKYLPFFNFGGLLEGITAINVLMYEMLSFIVIFILLYCILNILLLLSGLVEKILKFTIILAIPSKIFGAILGLIEGIIVAYLIAFVLLHIPATEEYVMHSKVAIVVLERTPFIGTIALRTTQSLEDINNIVNELDEESDRDQANIDCLGILVRYSIINGDSANKLIENNKIITNYKVEYSGGE